MHFGGKSYKVPLSSYTLFYKNVCYLLIIPKKNDSYPMWILGNNFLHNYYTIYDVQHKKIGIVPSNLGAQNLVEEGYQPIASNYQTELLVFFWTVIVCSVSYLVVSLIKTCMGKKKTTQDEKPEDNYNEV